MTALIVERGFGGVTSRSPNLKMGIKCSNTTEVYFDNVMLPQEEHLAGVWWLTPIWGYRSSSANGKRPFGGCGSTAVGGRRTASREFPAWGFSNPVSGSRTTGTGIYSGPGTSSPTLDPRGVLALSVEKFSHDGRGPSLVRTTVVGKPTEERLAAVSVGRSPSGPGLGGVASALER